MKNEQGTQSQQPKRKTEHNENSTQTPQTQRETKQDKKYIHQITKQLIERKHKQRHTTHD